MLASHAPAVAAAWVSVFAQPDQIGRCISLTLSAAFFVLKIADVAWLRMRCDRRSVIAMVAAVALLHAGVPAHWGAAYSPAPPVSVLALGVTLAMLVAVTAPARTPSHRSRRRDASQSLRIIAAALRRSLLAPPPPAGPARLRSLLPNRAPPRAC